LESFASRILFEDNHLLIVNKLPGEIVQGDKTGDEPMVETLKSYLKVKYNKPGDVFLGVVHRLDRPVSGAVIFARTSKALTRMNALLKDREVRKVYWAICPHPVPPPVGGGSKGGGWTADWIPLTHYLKKNEQQNKSYVHDLPGEGRQKAELRYRKIASGERYDLLEVELMTGRHHQIRVQLAAIGCPVKGDLKYGFPRSNPDGSISLHARIVEFVHPVNKELINIMAEPPAEKVWEVLKGLSQTDPSLRCH